MKPTKYEPLKRHLEGMFQHGEVRLSFAEIERILGFSLPPSAYDAQPWWSNTRAGHSQAAAWLDAGWKTATLDLAARQVSFVKAAALGVAEDGASFQHQDTEAIVLPIAALHTRALRMIDEHVKEHGGDRSGACVALLDQLANDRLAAMVDWFQKRSPPLTDDVDIVALIQEGRDERDERYER
ncbi:hypothetical protein ASD21_11385 [Caulobacter sp. Root1455]|uniref:DUF7662 domain-containing protein n=1 Tax=Caulobacter sp. Root1455 TaxID=1736465 RepID=UPI0006F55F17|nr:hypothetical protein [Caulobacter sp. Root1455]KQY93358.1 hypothetical protein ASD21_11385 [Caulobacter sp. Root1455]